MENLKEILLEKIKGLKSFQSKSKRFDDVRDYILENYNYGSFHESVFNIINDFPNVECLWCLERPKFKSFQHGYANFCGVTCSNRFTSSDQQTREKISKSVSKFNKSVGDEYWENRTKTHRESIANRTPEYSEYLKKKKSEMMKRIHKNRTDDERNIINKKISNSLKNSEKAKAQRIRRAKAGALGLANKRKSLKGKKLKDFNLRFGTKGICKSKSHLYKKYRKLVRFYTNRNQKYVKNIHLKGNDYHLDHKFSIKEGFLNKISPEIIGSFVNLEIITAYENLSKGSKCSITKDELLSSFKNLKIGDF